jgi:hypothetical protein
LRPRRSRFTPRILVVWLLLLAVSPVTAPFSTYDFSDRTTPQGPTSLHAKPAPDEPVANAGGHIQHRIDHRTVGSASQSTLRHTAFHEPLQVPLRI